MYSIWHVGDDEVLMLRRFYPHLDLCSRSQSRGVLKRARREVYCTPEGIAFPVLVVIAGVELMLWLFDMYVPEQWRSAYMSIEALTVVLPIVVALVVSEWVFRNRIRKAVCHILQEEGIHVCEWCGYRLDGSERVKCPECGKGVHDSH